MRDFIRVLRPMIMPGILWGSSGKAIHITIIMFRDSQFPQSHSGKKSSGVLWALKF